MILTVGSMRGLYKESFGILHRGDFTFLLLTFLAASRHLFFRIWCTWDPSTHASPGVIGVLAHFIQTHVTGGQSFDRPAPPTQQQHYHASSDRTGSHSAVSASSSTAIASPAAADRMVQITGGVLEAKEVSSWSQVVPSSLVYAWQIPRQSLWFPLSRLDSRTSRRLKDNGDRIGPSYSRNADPARNGWLRRNYWSTQQFVLHVWISHGPSSQYLLSTGVFLTICWQLCLYATGTNPLSLVRGDDKNRRSEILYVHTHDINAVNQAATKTIGTYARQLKPSETEVLLVMVGFGTLLSLLVFSRVALPLPDLVAGGNVVKDVRTDARAVALAHHVSSSVGGAGVGGRKGARGRFSGVVVYLKDSFSKLTMPISASASDTAVWTERQYSIAAENRLHLALGVVFARVVENVVLVGVLPRSKFTCRATGHCPPGPPLWELSRIIYPGGFSKAKRQDGFQVFGFMECDSSSALLTLISVVTVSMVLLLAQAVVLNRSYLSILAHLSLGWEIVDKKKLPEALPKSPTSTTPQQQQQIVPTPIWEPKRKYGKGELVFYPDAAGAMYRATSNSPEGRPYDREFRGMNERFRSELGHPATSELLCTLAACQFIATGLCYALWLVLIICGYYAQTYGLIWTVAANLVATHGALSVTMSAANAGESRTIGKQQQQPSGAMRALQLLNAEILEGNT